MRAKLSIQCVWSIALLMALPAWSSNLTPVEPAKLQKILNFYKSISSMEVDFKQTKTLKDIDLKLQSEGTLKVVPPKFVQWKILKPEPLTVELEDQKITIQSSSKTQTFSQSEGPSAQDRKSFSRMLSWLKMDAQAIAEGYDIWQSGESRYRFTSKDEKEPAVTALDMQLDKSGYVTMLKIEEASGDEIQIHFKKPKVSKSGIR